MRPLALMLLLFGGAVISDVLMQRLNAPASVAPQPARRITHPLYRPLGKLAPLERRRPRAGIHDGWIDI